MQLIRMRKLVSKSSFCWYRQKSELSDLRFLAHDTVDNMRHDLLDGILVGVAEDQVLIIGISDYSFGLAHEFVGGVHVGYP